MPEAKVQGYVVRFTPRGPDRISVKIGKKVLGALVGKGQDLSMASLLELLMTFRAGAGSVPFGTGHIYISILGGQRILSMEGGGSIKLSPEESDCVIQAAEAAIVEVQGRSK